MRYLLLAMAVLSGVSIPIQIAANKRLFESVKSPLLTVALVLSAGAIVAWALTLCIPAARGEVTMVTTAPWWAWSTAALIVFAIGVQISNSEQQGSGALIAFIIAGQLCCALMLDHFGAMQSKQDPIRWWKIVGVLAMAGGAALMQIKGR